MGISSGSVIKSVQRGITGSGAGTLDVTISAVNLSKSRLNFCGFNPTGSSLYCYASLPNSTTVRIVFNNSNGGTLSWEVVEYA